MKSPENVLGIKGRTNLIRTLSSFGRLDCFLIGRFELGLRMTTVVFGLESATEFAEISQGITKITIVSGPLWYFEFSV